MYKSLEPYYQMTTMDENLNWIPKPNMDVNALNSAPFICRMRSPPPTQGGGRIWWFWNEGYIMQMVAHKLTKLVCLLTF